ASAGIDVGELTVAGAPEELRLPVRLAQSVSVGPGSDDADGHAGTTRCLEGDVHALVAHQLRDDEQRISPRARCEALRLDRRVHDGRLAAVVALDSLPREL